MKSGRIFLFFLLLALISNSCKKDPVPENPYDSIVRPIEEQPEEPDPNTIVGLHKNIFFPKCANPGCHDGSFEPDYRTIQSTYSTLVYQQVNKTTLEDSLKFYSQRVIPNNTSDSWLIERLTTPSQEYMPSNGTRLTSAEIAHVQNWINAGCPDADGNLPVAPNNQPNIIGYFVVDSLTNDRIDSIRLNNYPLNPFIVQSNRSMRILFLATDTADGDNATELIDFTVHSIYFSLSKDNFAGALVIPGTFIPFFQAWLVDVPGTIWQAGTTVYFRIHVNDGDHPGNDSEFPRNSSFDYYKTLYSFYVQ